MRTRGVLGRKAKNKHWMRLMRHTRPLRSGTYHVGLGLHALLQPLQVLHHLLCRLEAVLHCVAHAFPLAGGSSFWEAAPLHARLQIKQKLNTVSVPLDRSQVLEDC